MPRSTFTVQDVPAARWPYVVALVIVLLFACSGAFAYEHANTYAFAKHEVPMGPQGAVHDVYNVFGPMTAADCRTFTDVQCVTRSPTIPADCRRTTDRPTAKVYVCERR